MRVKKINSKGNVKHTWINNSLFCTIFYQCAALPTIRYAISIFQYIVGNKHRKLAQSCTQLHMQKQFGLPLKVKGSEVQTYNQEKFH